jgi:uncharacterized protein
MNADDIAKRGRTAANEMPGGIALFLALALSFSSIFYYLIAKSGHAGGGWGAYIGCLMWCPGLAALLTCKYLGRGFSSLGWNWGRSRYEAVCYFIPLAYGAAIYAFVWLTGLGGFYNLFTATITVVRDCATVLGEEIGWRGFLVPELAKRHGFAATAIISGFIWALWHYPIFLLADGYNGGTTVWYYLPLFTVLLPAISFVWTWMRLKSGSLWPGVILHAAHNTFMQQFFDPLTVENTKTRYVAGEFGVALLVVSVLMAIYFWRRRFEVETGTRSVTFSN